MDFNTSFASPKLDIKDFLLDLFFPRFCFGCRKEGSYLCEDCMATLEISEYQYCLCKNPIRVINKGKCPSCSSKKLNGIYSALPYQVPLVRVLIKKFKYEPFIKDLAKTLALLIINHFQLLDNKPDFSGFVFIPIPLDKKKLKKRGFNQAKELAKELSCHLNIPMLDNVLIKTKENLPQADLGEKEREENMKGVFAYRNPDMVCGKKILLVDDVYTTGATMEEAARVLKESGVNQVWGITVARG